MPTIDTGGEISSPDVPSGTGGSEELSLSLVTITTLKYSLHKFKEIIASQFKQKPFIRVVSVKIT